MTEIKQISDHEFRIGGNSIRLDDNIVYVVAVGEQPDEIALAHRELHRKLCLQTGKLKYLIDLNGAGKSSSTARKIWQELADSEMTIKAALFGIHPVAKILASFVMGMITKNKMKFFNSKEEAELWLKE